MTSTEQKKIKALASLLPVKVYATNEYQEIKGEDLLLCGTKEVNGKPIEPEKTYIMKSPVINEANHYRRLKRAFAKSGKAGLVKYMGVYAKDISFVKSKIDILFK